MVVELLANTGDQPSVKSDSNGSRITAVKMAWGKSNKAKLNLKAPVAISNPLKPKAVDGEKSVGFSLGGKQQPKVAFY